MNGSNVLTTGGTAVLGVVVSASPRLTPLGTGMSPESAIVGALRQDKPCAGWHRSVVAIDVTAADVIATDVTAADVTAIDVTAIDVTAIDVVAAADAAFELVAYGAEIEPQRIQPHARLRNAHPATVIRSRHRSRPR